MSSMWTVLRARESEAGYDRVCRAYISRNFERGVERRKERKERRNAAD